MRRSNRRGTAAVELLLTVPFLFLFSVAMVDFAKGYAARAQVERAARHLAWSGARNKDHGSPSVPETSKLKGAHAAAFGSDFAATYHEKPKLVYFGIPVVGDILSWLNGFIKAAETAINSIPFINNFRILEGLPGFLTGEVELFWAEASLKVKARAGIGDVRLGSRTVKAIHYVSLLSYRESKPSDPKGWFDPMRELFDFIDMIWDKVKSIF